MLQAVAFSSKTLVLIPILLSPRVMVSILQERQLLARCSATQPPHASIRFLSLERLMERHRKERN